MARNGVIMYFNNWHSMDKFNYEEKGLLMDALIEYAEYGVLRELPPELDRVFPFLQNYADLDAEKYEEKCRKNRFARYCQTVNEADRFEYDEWIRYVDSSKHDQIA